jgi:hypothetical protein
MRSWTRRERGLGAGIVLMAVAALVVPAWAADPDEAAVEPATEAALPEERGVVDFRAAPSRAERERIDECMTEHGFGPGSQAGEVFTVPAPDGAGDELPAPPEPDPEFKRAAEECGLPKPPHAIAMIRRAAAARDGELCALPAPPPLLREERDER